MEISPLFIAAVSALAILALIWAGIALWVRREAREAERSFPPSGRFVEVDGVRLHYIEQGAGPPVVLVHGNGSQCRDFVGAGLMAELARSYRVIAIDRPGFGYSQRPRGQAWTPRRQARLLARACAALGAASPVVLGHSLGTLVALEMALDESLASRGLVLISGYYFPTARLDVWLMAIAAIPGLGAILRHTVLPLSAWMTMPTALRKTFGPQPVPRSFVAEVPPQLMVRPRQLKASVEDSAFMVPAALRLSRRYGLIRQPVEIFAGSADRIVHRQGSRQSGWLHGRLLRSELHMVPGAGHMLHYFGMNEQIARSVDRIVAVGSMIAAPGAEAGATLRPPQPPQPAPA